VVRHSESKDDGSYTVPLLQPGNYMLTVSAKGFQTVTRDGVVLAVDHAARIDFSLQVGSVSQKVEVHGEAPLIEPSNANTTTTFSATQLASLPNPGMDLTYIANVVPGAVMNTNQAGGFAQGNTAMNGLSSAGTDFIVDGFDTTDPDIGWNRTGASGLTLGLNSIQEASVNTLNYSAEYGRLGVAEISYITRSGANEFHGNAYELWNGSKMNASPFFLNADPSHPAKPFTNVNEFGGSIGGPILKKKLFFFGDIEGLRIIGPSNQQTILPTPLYQNFVLQQLPVGGTDPIFGTVLPPEPQEVPFFNTIFSLMGDTSKGVPQAVLGCPFNADGTPAPGAVPDGAGCANTRTFSLRAPIHETLFTGKLDFDPNEANRFWFRFQVNTGFLTLKDPVNASFDVIERQPVQVGSVGWTHTFNPRLVNEFTGGISYNSFAGLVRDPSLASKVPVAYGGTFTFVGIGLSESGGFFGTTHYQLNDNVAWSRGRHEFKFGEAFRRSLAGFDFAGEFKVPLVETCDLPEYTFGATCFAQNIFINSKANADRETWNNLEIYGMDTFKATSKLTVTVGLRVAWDSNQISQRGLLSRLNAASFDAITHDANRPLNQDVLAGQKKTFASLPLLVYQPRIALAFQPMSNTVIRAGFGVFGFAPAGFYEEDVLLNPPVFNIVDSGIFGSGAGGVAAIPGVPNSAIDAAVQANQQFVANFSSGALSCASPLAPAPPNCVPTLGSFFIFSGKPWYPPYTMQWSLEAERGIGANFLLTAKYVGTRAVRVGEYTGPNAFQTFCQGCFPPLPFNTAPDPRFGLVFEEHTDATSAYHALQVSAKERFTHGLSFLMNYTYSHCIDTVSNITPLIYNVTATGDAFPGQVAGLRGNCDYDIRHSLNGSYLYQLPFHSKNGSLNQVIGQWQVSGNVFVRTGEPESVFGTGCFLGCGIFNGFFDIFANAVPGKSFYHKSSISGVTQPGSVQWLNPDAFVAVIDPVTFQCVDPHTFAVGNNPQSCRQGNAARNLVSAPGFTWFDFSVAKGFKLTERTHLKFIAQFFNLFNHPNFGFPGGGGGTGRGFAGFAVAGIPGQTDTLTGFGGITGTTSPNTGLLGRALFLNTDASPRMIALQAKIEF
jgi:carboxypeptidase family protein